MTWHFWAALAAGLVAASLADWLFAGVLFHDRYVRHPEVWRTPGKNTRGIVAAQALAVPTVVGMGVLLNLIDVERSFTVATFVAALVWAIAAAPATIVNGVFIKLDPLVVAAHTAGWLVKLVAVALIVTALW
ncbi:MAG: hypothetical protein JO290_08815 [Sphingomonadaceae bacterium]|nr:hypothetical protein [Sphingomonadaceae bacterium]